MRRRLWLALARWCEHHAGPDPGYTPSVIHASSGDLDKIGTANLQPSANSGWTSRSWWDVL
jgi:hypothetical protein